MVKIILTGASGFLGKQILAELLPLAGPDVSIVALVRKTPQDVLPGVTYEHLDLPDVIPQTVFAEGKTIVLHFANLQISDDSSQYERINVEGTRRLLQACGSNTLGIVYNSSLSVLGQGAQYLATETQAMNPETDLARSKAAAERIVIARARELTCVGLCLRSRFVVGENDSFVRPGFEYLAERKLIIGTGEQQFSFISARAFAQIIKALCVQMMNQALPVKQTPLNIALKNPLKYRDILEILAGKETRFQKVPLFLKSLIGWLPLKRTRQLKTRIELLGYSHTMDVTLLESLLAAASEKHLLYENPLDLFK